MRGGSFDFKSHISQKCVFFLVKWGIIKMMRKFCFVMLGVEFCCGLIEQLLESASERFPVSLIANLSQPPIMGMGWHPLL